MEFLQGLKMWETVNLFKLACYFNCLIQFYFNNHTFVREVLNFKDPNISKDTINYDRIDVKFFYLEID